MVVRITHQYDLSIYDRALQWDEGRRDTTAVRGRIESMQSHGQAKLKASQQLAEWHYQEVVKNILVCGRKMPVLDFCDSRQFFMEAEAALPLLEPDSRELGQVFQAMQHQRAKLKASQQLAEWHY